MGEGEGGEVKGRFLSFSSLSFSLPSFPFSSETPDTQVKKTTTATLTSFPYYQLTNSNGFCYIYVIKHMANASSCTVELWMHLGDVLKRLLSSQELEVQFIDVISVLNGSMKHARVIEFDQGNILLQLCYKPNKPKKQYKYNRRYFCRITQYMLLVYTHLVILVI